MGTKFVKHFFFAALSTILFVSSSFAMRLVQVANTDNVDRYDILAETTDNSELAVQIRFTIIGGDFTNYLQEKYLVLPGCESGDFFTQKYLCVDLSKGSSLSDGESLGTIDIKWDKNASTKKVIYGTDAAYVTRSEKHFLEGTLIDLSLSESNYIGYALAGFFLISIIFASYFSYKYFIKKSTKPKKIYPTILAGLVLLLSLLFLYYKYSNLSILPLTGDLNIQQNASTIHTISNIMVLGDSISNIGQTSPKQYSQIVKSAIEKDQGTTIVYTNKAKNGSTTEDLSRQFGLIYGNAATTPKKKTLILITSGTNDVYKPMMRYYDIPDSVLIELSTNISQFVGGIMQNKTSFFKNGVSIYLMNVYDITDGTGIGGAYFKNRPINATANFIKIDKVYYDLAKKYPNILYVIDAHTPFLGHGYYYYDKTNPNYHPDDPAKWLVDSIHQNDLGNAFMGKEFLKEIYIHENNEPPVTPTIKPSIAPSPTPSQNPTTTPTLTPTATITPTPPDNSVICGPLDEDGDNKLTLFDFVNFAQVYNKTCSDQYPRIGCGAKDTDGNQKVDVLDFIYLSEHYGNVMPDCRI